MSNGCYQKCALVQALARGLGIELLYLPAYLANVRLESSQAELGIFHKSLFFNTTLP